MSEGAIYEPICNLTRAKFGHAVNPHLFRDCAATSVATEDPEHVNVIKPLLGHSSLQSSEKHYIYAQSLAASRRFQEFVLALRRQGRDASPQWLSV